MDENRNAGNNNNDSGSGGVGFQEAGSVLNATGKLAEKGRKSFGRRVSFAATAKVRLFEKSPSAGHGNDGAHPGKDDELSSDEDSDMDMEPATADAVSAVSPLKAPGTPTSRLPQVLSPESVRLDPLPSRLPIRSPSTAKGTTVATFDVKVGDGRREMREEGRDNGSVDVDDDLSSFSDDLDNVNNANEDNTMDFTTCIGGIEPDAAFQRLSEANTMDFTGCVGKVLSDLDHTALAADEGVGRDARSRSSDRNRDGGATASGSKYDELENDTMDLTTCIGGLLEDVETRDVSLQNTMDFTQAIPDSFIRAQPKSPMHPAIAALKLSSPSPFLVHSPLTPKRRHTSADADPNDDLDNIPFIDSIARPDLIGGSSLESPVSRHGQSKRPSKAASPHSTSTSLHSHGLGLGLGPSTSNRRANEDEEERLFQTFINTDTLNNPIASIQANGGHSANSSETIKEFLGRAGVRFMDNLTSLGRRETVGRPRESEVITPARHRSLLLATLPESEAIEGRCRELVARIMSAKEDIKEAEQEFLRSTCYNSAAGPEQLDDDAKHRVKTAKSVARLRARMGWYEWRASGEAPLNDAMGDSLAQLKQELCAVQQKEADIDAIGVPLVRLRDRLSSHLAKVEAQEEARAAVDWDQLCALQTTCTDLQSASASLDAEMTELARQEEELRGRLVAIQEEKRLHSKRVADLEAERAQLAECSDLALRELKSRMALLEALHGWHLVSLKPSVMVIEWSRSKGEDSSRIQARLALDTVVGSGGSGSGGDIVVVSAVQLFCVQATGVLRHAQSIVKIEAGRGLLRVLLSLLSQLDRLHHIDRSINGRLGLWANAEVASDGCVCRCSVIGRTYKYTAAVRVLGDRLELASVGRDHAGSNADAPDLCSVFGDAVDAANLGNRFLQMETFLEYLRRNIASE